MTGMKGKIGRHFPTYLVKITRIFKTGLSEFLKDELLELGKVDYTTYLLQITRILKLDYTNFKRRITRIH
jgi:hypothetical protein